MKEKGEEEGGRGRRQGNGDGEGESMWGRRIGKREKKEEGEVKGRGWSRERRTGEEKEKGVGEE